MKTVRVRKRVVALFASLLMVAVALFAFLTPPAQAQPSAVCVPSVTCVTLPPVTVAVPRLVTVRVTLPQATVTLPPIVRTVTRTVTDVVNSPARTVTQRITLPARTVTVQANGQPVQTVVRSVPAQTRTIVATQVQTLRIGADGQATTSRATLLPGTPVASATGTPIPTVTRTVTVPDADNAIDTPAEVVGFSLLFVLIGAILAFVASLIAGRFGYILGETHNDEKLLRDTIEDVRNKK